MLKKIHQLLCLFLSFILVLEAQATGQAIRYSGFTIEKVETLGIGIQQPLKIRKLNSAKKNHLHPGDKNRQNHCLSIIESSPFENKKIYYSKRQFIELGRRNPFIAEHIGKTLGIDFNDFAKYLTDHFRELHLKSSCVSLENLLVFQADNNNKKFTEVLSNWKDLYTVNSAACSGPAHEDKTFNFNIPIHDKSHLLDEKYIIRTYKDPRSEFRKYWRHEHFDAEDVREMIDISEFLRLANRFLINYKIVTNKQKKSKSKGVDYPDYDLEEELSKLGQGEKARHDDEEIQEVLAKLAKSRGLTVVEYKEFLEKEHGLPLESFIKLMRENIEKLRKKAKENDKDKSNGQGDEDKIVDEIVSDEKILEYKRALEVQMKGQLPKSERRADKLFRLGIIKNESEELNFVKDQKKIIKESHPIGLNTISLRHLAKDIFYHIENFRIKRGKVTNDPAKLFPKDKLQSDLVTKSFLLQELKGQEKKLQQKLLALEEAQIEKLNQREHKLPSQDMAEKFELLEKKIQSGEYKKSDLQNYEYLKAQKEFGIIDFESIKKPRSAARKVYNPVKKIFQYYNRYATDTIIDIGTEKLVDSSLNQLQPLSKARSKVFRLTKGLDGGFILTTTVLGLTLAPFTFGLSIVASDIIKATASPFFSLLTSASKREPFDSSIARAGARAGHGYVESLIPGLGTANSFFTSVDDLRVAFKVHEYFNKFRRGKEGAVKVRWETLGSPLILSFLRERLDYVSQGLLPRGKFFYSYSNLPVAKKNLLHKVLKELNEAKLYLEESLSKSRLRYDYLLKSGKIPNFMLQDVIVNLDHEERNRKFISQPQFQEDKLMEEMKKRVLIFSY